MSSSTENSDQNTVPEIDQKHAHVYTAILFIYPKL